MRKAAVLGCGPAGLLAVHALNEYGIHADVFSIKQRSEINGAQYLHRAIPDITSDDPTGYIRFTKVGERDVYATKVYGYPTAPVSWDDYDTGTVPMWSMESAYAKLWNIYHKRIINTEVDAGVVQTLLDRYPYDEIISTIPRRVICRNPEHDFSSQRITIKHRHLPEMVNRPNEVVYDGTPYVGWYRWSIINGHESAEYAQHASYVDPDPEHFWKLYEGFKPLSHNCNCWAESNITFAGRFGRWEKGVLIHHAYEQVKEVAQNALHEMR